MSDRYYNVSELNYQPQNYLQTEEEMKQKQNIMQFSEFAQLFFFSEFDTQEPTISNSDSDSQKCSNFQIMEKIEEISVPQQIKKEEDQDYVDSNKQFNFNKKTSKSKKIKKGKAQQTNDKKPQQKKKEYKKKSANYNVTKNYIFGILKFIQQNDQQVLEYLKKNNLTLPNQYQFFHETLNNMKKECYSIKHFKELINLEGVQGKIIRTFGYKFIREESYQYFYQRSFKNRIEYLQLKHLLLRAFYNPEYFNQLKY